MACSLKPTQSIIFDASGPIGATPTVFVKSSNALLRVTSALIETTPLPVAADGKISVPALKAGSNILLMTVAGANASDDVQLMEDCGTAKPGELGQKLVGGGAAGANPVIRFN